VKQFASADFWRCMDALPEETQALAKRNFGLLKRDAAHPSLQFKQISKSGLVSVRVGLRYRALGNKVDAGVVWFWIGSHAEYDRLLR
jgi:hypothetical protein